MLERVVTKRSLRHPRLDEYDLVYWLSKAPGERVAAVDYLRKQFYEEFIANKRALGRQRDLADIEALGEI